MEKTEKWGRINYHPCIPLGDNNSKITGSKRHIDLSREAATEGTVLLKNDNAVLPLENGARVAVFGKAQIDYVKGGGGAGDVHCEYVRNIYEGLKKKDGKVQVFDELSLFYGNIVENAPDRRKLEEPEIPSELLKKARKFTDTAIITVSRFSEEGSDRYNDGKDSYFVLSANEKKMAEKVSDTFEKVIVLLNTGAMIDASWFAENGKIQAALMIWQGGMEGGIAAADVLCGDVNPSGKLVDTCAVSFDDYPSSEGFHESEDYVKYTEDIFVGYRYFETIHGKKERVVYPFGYGLSYTDFDIYDIEAQKLNDKILVNATVKNVGERAGKEVVQVYYSAPEGKITKPAVELCAFAKTRLLEAGETQTLTMSFKVSDMASYDDIGVVEKSAYVLEKGIYKIYVGNSVRNTVKTNYEYILDKDVVIDKLTEYCAPYELGKRLTASGEYVTAEKRKTEPKKFTCEYNCAEKIPTGEENRHMLIDVVNGKISLDDFIAQLTDEEMMNLLKGQKNTGVANTDGMGNLPEYGIPAPMTSDGPAGVRIKPYTGIRTTAFPVATMLACTWNEEIVEKVGAAGALEMKENNLFIWLTPALNIHRSPLCGRNFEYYSEDPFVAGKMAAAMVRGIQSQGIAATPKHFACNNKETNRFESNSIVSERALREIYLKGFEICVKESKPKVIMTSYNKLNGTWTSENAELITGILRNEWGYEGLVTTDWACHASQGKEIAAGNDIRMPSGAKMDVEEYYVKKAITRNQLAVCVKRLLEMILWLE